jgi:hypothetical protein
MITKANQYPFAMNRTESQKALIWKQFDSRRWGYLRWGRREARNAILKSIKPVQDLLNSGSIERTKNNISIDDTPMMEFYRRLYTNVGERFGRESFESLAGKMKQEGDWTQAVSQWIGVSAFERIELVNLHTKDRIVRLMDTAIREGWSIQDLSARMASDVGGVNRATRIARTEIISASNKGSLEGARATNLPLNKVWLATRDDRTRETHSAIDGQEVPMDEPFDIDGYKLDFAGDFTHGAPPEEVINCRCTQIYNVRRE